MGKFKEMLPRLREEAVGSYLAGTPNQKTVAERLQSWVKGLEQLFDDDASSDAIAEAAFVIGHELAFLIVSNDFPTFDAGLSRLRTNIKLRPGAFYKYKIRGIGTPEENARRVYDEMRATYKELMKKQPTLSRMELVNAVAGKHDVMPKTVMRQIPNPSPNRRGRKAKGR